MIHALVAILAYGETRRRGLIRVAGAVAFVAALLYWEQTEILYVLSTLAMCGLKTEEVWSSSQSSWR